MLYRNTTRRACRTRGERDSVTINPKKAARTKAVKKAWYEANRFKRSAHFKFQNAIRTGKISRPSKCQKCGNGGRIEAHHDDYSKPLDVIFLCRKCHCSMHTMAGPPITRMMGEANGASKLTQAKVNEIRNLVKSGESQRSVAIKFLISESNVRLIIGEETWKQSTN